MKKRHWHLNFCLSITHHYQQYCSIKGIEEMWSSCRRWMTRCTASLSSLQLGRQRILEWNIEMTSSYQRVNQNQERQGGVGSGLGNEILPTWLRINFLPCQPSKAQQEEFSTQQGIVKTRTSHFFICLKKREFNTNSTSHLFLFLMWSPRRKISGQSILVGILTNKELDHQGFVTQGAPISQKIKMIICKHGWTENSFRGNITNAETC